MAGGEEGGVTDLGGGTARVDLSFKTYWESQKTCLSPLV